MNQILTTNVSSSDEIKSKNKLKSKLLKFQLLFSICIAFVSLYIYLKEIFFSVSNENTSKKVANNFKIISLYSNNSNYSVQKLSALSNNTTQASSIVGVIQIDKLNVSYPILAGISDDLLKVSICRFYGPLPNKIGNLCLAGHNYDNNTFFSNLHNLNYEDSISITDSLGTTIDYYVYFKYEVKSDDLYSVNQNTNNQREITLVTCNNLNGNRLVVKAIEKK